MSKKIGIVVSATSGIDYLKIDFPVEIIRLTLNLDKKEYEDYVDITAEEFYDVVVKNPNIDLSTSQPSTGKIAEVYEKLKKEGYSDIIVISVGSKLSGTYQGAVLAKEMVKEINIHVFDSKSVAYGEIALVNKTIEMIKQGFDVKDILKTLDELCGKINFYLAVDTLKYLVKNGRLSATQGFLGKLLKVKPILKIKDGIIVPHEKIRTTVKARARLVEIVKEETKGKNAEYFIHFTNNKEEAEEIKMLLLAENPNLDVKVSSLTPVVGVHAGPGTIAIGYVLK